MKKIGFMGLVLSELFGCAAQGPMTVEDISQLSDARISYSSLGCFHHQRYEVTIRDNVLHVVDASMFSSKNGPLSTTYLGHVMLDEKKIADLNKMFELLSTTQGRCSTTQLNIDLSYTNLFGQRVFQSLSDSCAEMPNDGSYTLDAAIDDVEMKQKRL
ncbi:hypothetical protein [Photobacterium sp. TY1-4]|uniref:hypothetical protein n=1 Tax=Photobacterium sp. TY1-4 TaxID=2899122 RepID=UPI0021C0EC39|nr:hypothetical protein [Photobacterium sp. TY1-4]UXH99915.1 hypothetical protein NH461_08695 [Photobacterium sp. TY1-4]